MPNHHPTLPNSQKELAELPYQPEDPATNQVSTKPSGSRAIQPTHKKVNQTRNVDTLLATAQPAKYCFTSTLAFIVSLQIFMLAELLQSANQSLHQPTNQPTNHSTNQPTNHSINHTSSSTGKQTV